MAGYQLRVDLSSRWDYGDTARQRWNELLHLKDASGAEKPVNPTIGSSDFRYSDYPGARIFNARQK